MVEDQADPRMVEDKADPIRTASNALPIGAGMGPTSPCYRRGCLLLLPARGWTGDPVQKSAGNPCQEEENLIFFISDNDCIKLCL